MSIIIHQGNIPGQLQVTDQNSWYVSEETWRGSQLVRVTILDRFRTYEEAEAYARKVRAE